MVKTWNEPIAGVQGVHLCCGWYCSCLEAMLDFLADRGSLRLGMGRWRRQAAHRGQALFHFSFVNVAF